MKRKLTDSAIKHAKLGTEHKTRSLADGGGLRLLITSTGKYWRYRYRFNGKPNNLALGTYPEITLKAARELHEEARKVLASGVDLHELSSGQRKWPLHECLVYGSRG